MRPYPTCIHGHRYERCRIRGDYPCGGDRADTGDGDLVGGWVLDRANLVKPLDVHTIRELYHHRPPITHVPAVGPTRIETAGIPNVQQVRRLPGLPHRVVPANLLQQSDIGAHPHQLTPRRPTFGDIPTHNSCDQPAVPSPRQRQPSSYRLGKPGQQPEVGVFRGIPVLARSGCWRVVEVG